HHPALSAFPPRRSSDLNVRCASVAQLVEQGTENPRVIGSIPIGGTICGRSSSGRAPPCQGGGSEFEPRRPLHGSDKHHSYGAAEDRKSTRLNSSHVSIS